ncbi:MAG: OsmC family protein [Gemmatimonadota bacterium]
MIAVDWNGEGRFTGTTPDGATLELNTNRGGAPGPVQALIISLASCLAIDVVEILAKRRTPAASLRVEVEYDRAETAPRRLTAVDLRFIVETASEAVHVERAVEMVLDRYCSVASSLDPAIPITTRVEVLPVGVA